MAVIEDVRRLAERATGWRRPARKELPELVRPREPRLFRFEDDGVVPNHPRWPLGIYRNAVKLPTTLDSAAVFEELFAQNGWGDSWRDSVYDYLHYHSRIHEVMGVARGSAMGQFGGKPGRKNTVNRADGVMFPSGPGHKCLSANVDFLAAGAYPAAAHYDVLRSS